MNKLMEETKNVPEKWEPDEEMYHKDNVQILDHKDCPHISVLIPTYNRRKFLPLVMSNLMNMDYPKHKMEVCIIDDGKEPLFVDDFSKENCIRMLSPISINYHRFLERHLSIGEKRNKLVKMAKHKIVANMDDDDLYLPTYLRYAVSVLMEYKVGIVHSPQMVFVFPNDNFKTTAIVCQAKRQGHEATQVFTKKHFNSMGGYEKSSQGEGAKMVDFNEKKCRCLDVRMCMMCICHNNNTIDKNLFNKDHMIIDCDIDDSIKRLITVCLQ
jgi:glycosyltransferase involved in cell wall biosynthesis